MKVLGLSSGYHDSAAALVIDGVVVAAAAEERFTRVKHDPSFPELSAQYCLEMGGISASELDYVAYHEDPEVKFSRAFSSSLANFPFSFRTFARSMKESITGGFWIRNTISKTLDIHPRKIVCVPHHLSHAAHAFRTSPFSEAAILTVDAVGEWTCTGLFQGRTEAGSVKLDTIGLVPFPNSLGLVYSAFTAFLGFKANDGECSTMALAAFGQPRFADEVRRVIRVKGDGSYDVDLSYFDFSKADALPITKKFVTSFGEPRSIKSSLPFDCLSGEIQADPENQRYADIAASVQLVLEEAVIALAKKIRKETGSQNLCLGGGVALNCVANSKLIAERIFENVYIPPDPGDGGGAMGAALYIALRENEPVPTKAGEFSAYLGQAGAKEGDRDASLEMARHLKPEEWNQYRRKGLKPLNGQLKITKTDDIDSLAQRTAELIAEGKIVGWVQGRFENGPRALGNRSILADPSNLETARRLSRQVKLRAPFRPYAFSITEEDSKRVFDGSASLPAKWMQVSMSVQEAYRPKLRAALHIDGSTRPQVCTESDNPRFHALLSAYGRKTGLSALLNTSFNEKGLPLVTSYTDALLMFARTDLDVLILDEHIVEKAQ